MMTKPGITELSKCVDSRYTLVTMAAKRARMIGEKEENLHSAHKPVSIAVEEIAKGKVGYIRRERCYNEDSYYMDNIKDDSVDLDEAENKEDTQTEDESAESAENAENTEEE